MDKEKEDIKEKALDFLKNKKVAVISTVSSDNKPQSATVFYTVDSSFNFYFFTLDNTKKYNNLENFNLASMVVFSEESPVIVQAEGVVSLVENESEGREMASRLAKVAMDSSRWYDPPIAKLEGGEIAILKLQPSWLRIGDFTASDRDKIFTQIIS